MEPGTTPNPCGMLMLPLASVSPVVRPGVVVRVRHMGVDLRLTETNYDHDAGEVTLTLGDPVYSTEQRVAAIADGRVLRRAANGYTAPVARYGSASYSTLYVYA